MSPLPAFGEDDLKAVLVPLGEYLSDLVVCGSWTLFIHRHWVLKKPGPIPVRSKDVDAAVPKKLPVRSEPLATRLEKEFDVELSGGTPPVMHFTPKDAMKGSAPYLEFITPHKGGGEPEPVTVQRGLVAQPLRYLEIILENFAEVAIPGTKLTVRVATPAAYAYQKGLSFVRRQKTEGKAKDLAYLFDLLHGFPDLRGSLVPQMRAMAGRYPKPWWSTLTKNFAGYFRSATSEGVKLVESQQPEPYAKMLAQDATNGPSLFRELVYAEFARWVEELRDSRK